MVALFLCVGGPIGLEDAYNISASYFFIIIINGWVGGAIILLLLCCLFLKESVPLLWVCSTNWTNQKFVQNY